MADPKDALAKATPRTPLEMAMWAAWLGVNPEQVPPEYTAHTCADTMARWRRVGEAAVALLKAEMSHAA